MPERLRPVLEATAPIAERFQAAGKRLFLVGGPVRDGIAGRPGGGEPGPEADIDLTTNATPDEVEALVAELADAFWTQGKRFGTIGLMRAGRRFEITTHRAEAYVPESRKPEVRFGDDIETDLSRRDFTVNAMALEPAGARARRPLRRHRRPGSSALTDTARPGGVVLGRPSPHAPGGPVHRRL